jgi:hypothetical protein
MIEYRTRTYCSGWTEWKTLAVPGTLCFSNIYNPEFLEFRPVPETRMHEVHGCGTVCWCGYDDRDHHVREYHEKNPAEYMPYPYLLSKVAKLDERLRKLEHLRYTTADPRIEGST